MESNVIKPGLYMHCLQGLYFVYGTARHTETDEEMVVYCDAQDTERLYVRTASMWFSEVGVTEDGRPITRFRRAYDGK